MPFKQPHFLAFFPSSCRFLVSADLPLNFSAITACLCKKPRRVGRMFGGQPPQLRSELRGKCSTFIALTDFTPNEWPLFPFSASDVTILFKVSPRPISHDSSFLYSWPPAVSPHSFNLLSLFFHLFLMWTWISTNRRPHARRTLNLKWLQLLQGYLLGKRANFRATLSVFDLYTSSFISMCMQYSKLPNPLKYLWTWPSLSSTEGGFHI